MMIIYLAKMYYYIIYHLRYLWHSKVYTFQKIADFQYLPMSCSTLKKPTTTTATAAAAASVNQATSQYVYTSFYDNFLFTNMQDYEHEFRKNQLPQLFILPPFFSRFDDPVSYAFRSEPVKKSTNAAPSSAAAAAESTTNNDEDTTTTTTTAATMSFKQSSAAKTSSRNTDNDVTFRKSTETNMNNSVSAAENSLVEEATTAAAALSTSRDESNNPELIRSMRQERSSQAYLLTFSSKEIPSSMCIII